MPERIVRKLRSLQRTRVDQPRWAARAWGATLAITRQLGRCETDHLLAA